MFDRRDLLRLAATAPLTLAGVARAADWRTQYPEIRFSVVPSENEDGLSVRWAPFVDYLSRELRVKVTLRVVNDYAALIEGQRSGNIHVGYYGSAAFARALLVGVRTEAFAQNVSRLSGQGYYSVFYVLASSPYRTVEDLHDKNLGLVDPNSTSGYQVPLYTLDKMGIDPDKFFKRMVITGSHENAVTALVGGTVDVAANAWNSDSQSYLRRMLTKGMLKRPDGRSMTYEDFRIVLKSPMIVNGPYTYLADLPAEMKAEIRTAFFAAPTKAKDAFDKISDGESLPWQPVDNATYDDIVKLIRFVDALRKKRS